MRMLLCAALGGMRHERGTARGRREVARYGASTTRCTSPRSGRSVSRRGTGLEDLDGDGAVAGLGGEGSTEHGLGRGLRGGEGAVLEDVDRVADVLDRASHLEVVGAVEPDGRLTGGVAAAPVAGRGAVGLRDTVQDPDTDRITGDGARRDGEGHVVGVAEVLVLGHVQAPFWVMPRTPSRSASLISVVDSVTLPMPEGRPAPDSAAFAVAASFTRRSNAGTSRRPASSTGMSTRRPFASSAVNSTPASAMTRSACALSAASLAAAISATASSAFWTAASRSASMVASFS